MIDQVGHLRGLDENCAVAGFYVVDNISAYAGIDIIIIHPDRGRRLDIVNEIRTNKGIEDDLTDRKLDFNICKLFYRWGFNYSREEKLRGDGYTTLP